MTPAAVTRLMAMVYVAIVVVLVWVFAPRPVIAVWSFCAQTLNGWAGVTPEQPTAPSVPLASSAPAAVRTEAPGASVLYVTRHAPVREAPSAVSTRQLTTLERATAVQGVWVTGASDSRWLKLTAGPWNGYYVSAVNLATQPRPRVITVVDADLALRRHENLLDSPALSAAAIEALSPNLIVRAHAEVEGGWMEIQRRAGGVGYLPVSALGPPPRQGQ